jgi:putative beta-barrel porin BBP2
VVFQSVTQFFVLLIRALVELRGVYFFSRFASVNPAHSPRRPSLNRVALAATVFGLTLASSVSAQDAVPGGLGSADSSVLSQHEVDALRGTTPAAQPAVNGQELAETPRRLNYGLALTVRGIYSDNINISSINRASDYYIAIEPTFSFGFGGKDDSAGTSSLSFVYRPSIFLFVDHSENDAIQHLIRLTGSHNFGHLTLSASQDVQLLDGTDLNSLSDPTGHNANTDVGQRTKHNIFTTQISDTYDLTGKLYLSNSIALSIDDYESFTDSKNISGNLFINYQYSEKLAVGVGGTFGYNTVEQGSPDQTYEQANVRLNYSATGKLSFGGSVGVEFRQFDDSSFGATRGTNISPVFELNGTYRPFDGTNITLSGSRRIQNSASLGGQDYTQTDVHVAIGQRFMTRFTLGFAVGYENSDYFSAFQGVSGIREDNYYYVQPTIDAQIMRWWTIGAYYLYRKDSSSLAFFSFDDNQIGLRSTITF